jgi:hypothetical protein
MINKKNKIEEEQNKKYGAKDVIKTWNGPVLASGKSNPIQKHENKGTTKKKPKRSRFFFLFF